MQYLFNKILNSLVGMIFLISSSGCATIVSGKTSDVNIHSNPNGATVYINEIQAGSTPVLVDLKRKERHTVRFVKEGYLDETRVTSKAFNWWFVGNLIFGGIIGIIVDFATGAVYKINPEDLNVSMTVVPVEKQA